MRISDWSSDVCSSDLASSCLVEIPRRRAASEARRVVSFIGTSKRIFPTKPTARGGGLVPYGVRSVEVDRHDIAPRVGGARWWSRGGASSGGERTRDFRIGADWRSPRALVRLRHHSSDQPPPFTHTGTPAASRG